MGCEIPAALNLYMGCLPSFQMSIYDGGRKDAFYAKGVNAMRTTHDTSSQAPSQPWYRTYKDQLIAGAGLGVMAVGLGIVATSPEAAMPRDTTSVHYVAGMAVMGAGGLTMLVNGIAVFLRKKRESESKTQDLDTILDDMDDA